VVIVWGPLQDTITAAEEIRLRYVDAIDGVPNETRQPFADGSTDFERILPGPDRMYPDTDSPPTRMTRARVARLEAALPPPPWERERRYADAGVPRPTIHYLIRRGGAAIVDRVVEEAGADTRTACLFFGERLKGLRRRRWTALEDIPAERWCELFRHFQRRPVLAEAWRQLVAAMARDPGRPLGEILEGEGLAEEYGEVWRQQITATIEASPDHRVEVDGLERFRMGRIMAQLRGRIAAREVLAALRSASAAAGALRAEGGER
jgi:glutamyl-tRNA(Gln) amidotransferase subunit E